LTPKAGILTTRVNAKAALCADIASWHLQAGRRGAGRLALVPVLRVGIGRFDAFQDDAEVPR